MVHLPLKLQEGYGPFHPGFSPLSEEHRGDPLWGKIYLSVKGVPKSWTNVKKSMVWMNSGQLVYQNFKAGNISAENYRLLQKGWQWQPDTTRLSSKPIKCYVYAISGFDEQAGKWAVMVDTNNNLDFGDETAIHPVAINQKDPYPYKDTDVRRVQYEVYRNGKVIAVEVPMVVKTMGSEFLYNFPQYATVSLKQSNKDYELFVSSGFTRPDFERSDVTQAAFTSGSGKVSADQLTKRDETLILGGTNYRNKGVDVFTNTLTLEPVDPDRQEYSLQVGYPFRPFTATEFTTKKAISLANFKGKYVYVDFWHTGCKGCVLAMPSLKKTYHSIDKSRFEFVGIAADSPERLSRFIKKEKIAWPQILSDDANKLVEIYHVTGYPTSVLLDPNGIVIAKDLQGDQLQSKLSALSR